MAGGEGTGSGLASQGAIQISNDGHYLIAVDAGSNQISVLRIRHDGSLHLVPKGVVSSGGATPVSVAVNDNLVYVANAATGANANGTKPNYSGFTIDFGGHLRPLPKSTVTLPLGSQPADVLFNGPGTSLVGTRAGTSEIDSFVVGRNGLLTAAPDSPSARSGTRTIRQRIPADQPRPAVRVQRPQRRSRHRNDLSLQRRPQRVTVLDRGYSVRGRPDCTVLD